MKQDVHSKTLPCHYDESDLNSGSTDQKEQSETEVPQPQPYRRQIVWFNAIGFLVLHLVGVYSGYVFLTQTSVPTTLWAIFLTVFAGIATTMGAHRMYAHKAFKAKPFLRLLLVIFHTVAGQNCLHIWVRDHRQHHKYSDTDADPHNSTRGFFFSHIGWLMVRKHPEVIAKGKNIDISDLDADPFVVFQKKYYKTLYTILAIGLPVLIPMWLWEESLMVAFMVPYMLRTILTLNVTWMVNSYAHMFGTRPFNKGLVPVEAPLVAFFGFGEGWHNYHHAFPWDYKASELGQRYNVTTWILDKAAKYGWVYDLRTVSPDMVRHWILKKGDGSHHLLKPKQDKQTALEGQEGTHNIWNSAQEKHTSAFKTAGL